MSTSWDLYVRHNDLYPEFDRYAYMSFDLAKIDATIIQSAELHFTAAITESGGTEIGLNARALTQPWSSSTVTFATRPAMGYLAGTTTIDNIKQVRTMDVTEFVRSNAGKIASLGFTEDNPPNGLGFVASISSLRSSTKPFLVVQTLPVG
ncbi:hypothetical protein RCH16_003697 [Cryobacterium sp. MP_M5]|nr:hypothetical protein [Cryobacterium sp. MP_M3]MEC5178657.1 hypothetical protein [Cryobacterium sp. MP_M5]